MFHSHVPRRIATAIAAAALSIGGFAVLASSPAGAVGGPNPPTPASPGVLNEVDCFAGAPADQALPVIIGLSGLQVDVGATHPTGLLPTGEAFGISGAYTVNFVGPFVEGLLEAGLEAPNLQITAAVEGLQFGQTDHGVTGANVTLPALGTKLAPVVAPANTTDLTDASSFVWAAGTGALAGLGTITSPSGLFTNPAIVGDGIYTGSTASLQSAIPGDFPTGTQVQEILSPNEIVVSNPPTTAASGTDIVLVSAISIPVPFATSNTAFTTNGTAGSTADLGLKPNGMNTVGTDGPQTVGFSVDNILNSGAFAGVPANAPCVLTGFTAGGAAQAPGIELLPVGGPYTSGAVAFPPTAGPRISPYAAYAGGGLANLNSAGTSPDPGTVQAGDGVSIPLGVTAPTPVSQSVSMGVGGSTTITLGANPGSYPIGAFSLNPASPVVLTRSPSGTLTATLTNAATGAVSLVDTGTAPQVLTFTFNACDNEATPVCSTAANAGTVTVNIGSSPVIQPFSENVVGGQLVISCDSPSNYVTPAATPPGPTLNPLGQCPEFQFPAITLDGLEQTVTSTTGNTGGVPGSGNPGTIYISDNRGSPLDQWTLTGTFIATPIGSAPGDNSNAACGGIVAFCNATTGPGTVKNGSLLLAPLNTNGVIAPDYLQVGGVTCYADSTGGSGTPPYNPPNLNPNAIALSGTTTFGNSVGTAVPVSLCSAAQGVSGGTFLYNATYSLTIPESVYAGNYFGSVQYTVG